ncbi:MAG: hypothetical protein GX322_02950 [Firmicutes bacterium]|nr:hypothetical protein [Bacillota bacterium]
MKQLAGGVIPSLKLAAGVAWGIGAVGNGVEATLYVSRNPRQLNRRDETPRLLSLSMWSTAEIAVHLWGASHG